MAECHVQVILEVPKKNSVFKHPSMPPNMAVYVHGNIIKGKLSVDFPPGWVIDHYGVTISLLGVYSGPSAPSPDPFFTRTLQLLPAARIWKGFKTPFTFDRIALPTTSYYGSRVQLSYRIECTIVGTDLGTGKEFYVVRPEDVEIIPLHKGIGVTNLLHLEVLLQSIVVDPRIGFIGCLYFALAKIRIIAISLELIRREAIGEETYETVLKTFEVLDGSPVKGVIIPVRFFLGDLNVWPVPKELGVAVSYSICVHGLDEAGGKYIRQIPVRFAFKK
jgi:vacuolar protein sorting-associated protein 26